VSSLVDSPVTPFTFVEQRLFLRKKLALPLPIEIAPGKEVWLDNVGEGGLCVSTTSRLEPGSQTFLKFDFPVANATIEAAGVVAWSENGKAGVRFTRIKPDCSAALKRWLKAETEDKAEVPREIVPPPIEARRPWDGVSTDVAKLRAEISSRDLQSLEALQLITDRMLQLTRAGGAAIAWNQNGEVVCQASAGNAPGPGTRLELSSLTGECYRSGSIVTLADAESDSRANPELSRALNFRSLVIVPLRVKHETIGIAEVLSPTPGNFDSGDTLLLCSIAELIAGFYPPHSVFFESPANVPSRSSR
jgi:putative methionine-R-sulfoxide reductase with GAF domain